MLNEFFKNMGNKMNENIISKYNPPTKFEQLPVGTIWIVQGDHPEYFIQLSYDVEKPQWERLGTFFETIFKEHITNEIFLIECLKLFAENKKA